MVLFSASLASLPTREGRGEPRKGLPAGTRDMARVRTFLAFVFTKETHSCAPTGAHCSGV